MNVKKWRQKNGLSLGQLALSMKYAKGYLSEVENGKKMPSGRLLRAYDKISKGEIKPSDFSLSKRK